MLHLPHCSGFLLPLRSGRFKAQISRFKDMINGRCLFLLEEQQQVRSKQGSPVCLGQSEMQHALLCVCKETADADKLLCSCTHKHHPGAQ